MANIENRDQELVQRQFEEVLTLIQAAHTKVMYAANTTMLELYWSIGAYISGKIAQSQWGDSVVKELAEYLAIKAPESKGFSAQNLWRVKQFYETYCNVDEKLSPLLREIAPDAEHVFRDDYVMEFIGGKTYPRETSMKSALIKQMKQSKTTKIGETKGQSTSTKKSDSNEPLFIIFCHTN